MNAHGYTALFVAAFTGNHRILKMLIDAGLSCFFTFFFLFFFFNFFFCFLKTHFPSFVTIAGANVNHTVRIQTPYITERLPLTPLAIAAARGKQKVFTSHCI